MAELRNTIVNGTLNAADNIIAEKDLIIKNNLITTGTATISGLLIAENGATVSNSLAVGGNILTESLKIKASDDENSDKIIILPDKISFNTGIEENSKINFSGDDLYIVSKNIELRAEGRDLPPNGEYMTFLRAGLIYDSSNNPIACDITTGEYAHILIKSDLTVKGDSKIGCVKITDYNENDGYLEISRGKINQSSFNIGTIGFQMNLIDSVVAEKDLNVKNNLDVTEKVTCKNLEASETIKGNDLEISNNSKLKNLEVLSNANLNGNVTVLLNSDESILIKDKSETEKTLLKINEQNDNLIINTLDATTINAGVLNINATKNLEAITCYGGAGNQIIVSASDAENLYKTEDGKNNLFINGQKYIYKKEASLLSTSITDDAPMMEHIAVDFINNVYADFNISGIYLNSYFDSGFTMSIINTIYNADGLYVKHTATVTKTTVSPNGFIRAYGTITPSNSNESEYKAIDSKYRDVEPIIKISISTKTYRILTLNMDCNIRENNEITIYKEATSNDNPNIGQIHIDKNTTTNINISENNSFLIKNPEDDKHLFEQTKNNLSINNEEITKINTGALIINANKKIEKLTYHGTRNSAIYVSSPNINITPNNYMYIFENNNIEKYKIKYVTREISR